MRARAGHRAVLPPAPDRSARRAPGLGRHRPVLAHLRVRQVGVRPPPERLRRPGLDHAGGLRDVGDVRASCSPTGPTPPARPPAGPAAGSCPATSSACSTSTPASRSGSARSGELAVARPHPHAAVTSVEAPADCFDADGFFHTGDAGHVDERGEVHFDGRRTEMIKTGGANVSPAELEVALRACAPGEADREAS